MAKRTALYEEHLKLKGRMVEFGGWEMPVQYTSIADEHETCRKNVTLFDVSHMGEIRVRGSKALEFLNSIVTNNLAIIKDGQAQYTAMCYESGGCVDDLIIHRFAEDDFFICANASNTDKDFEWIKNHSSKGVSVENVSADYSQIAVQGRHAEAIMRKLSPIAFDQLKYYWFATGSVAGVDCIVARTGYTGEDGFEIYCPWHSGPQIWTALLETGASYSIKPCGLGARDTLRTEMKYSLYGHEIDKDTSPLEAGLSWVVKFDKGDFIGRDSLLKQKTSGNHLVSVGIKTLGKGIPRQGYTVESRGQRVGLLTSGTLSPSLKYGIGIARLDKNFSEIGTKLDVDIRGQKVEHEVVQTPFYKRGY